MPKSMNLQDPKTGEWVAVDGVPDDMTPEQASAAHFAPAATGLTKYKNLAIDAASGGVKGVLDTGKMYLKGLAGMGMAAAGNDNDTLEAQAKAVEARDPARAAALRANAASGRARVDRMGQTALGVEDTALSVPGFRQVNDFADAPPHSTAGGYLKSGAAGATSALTGPSGPTSKITTATLGALGGVGAQAAGNANLGPIVETAASLAPFVGYGAFRGMSKPSHVTEIQQALEGLKPEELVKARALMADAKARGVDLSPAQVFGDQHPLVSTLNRLGSSWGGSSLVKNFLLKQEAPVNAALDTATSSFGDARGVEAGTKVGAKATQIWGDRSAVPSKKATPFYEAAAQEPIQQSVWIDAIKKMRDYFGEHGFAPNSNAAKALKEAEAKLVQRTVNVSTTDSVPTVLKGRQLDKALEKHGSYPGSHEDSLAALERGDSVYVFSEQDGKPTLVTDPKMLDAYGVDETLILPAGRGVSFKTHIDKQPIYPGTGGEAKSIRDDMRATWKEIPAPGSGGSDKAMQGAAYRAVRDASQTSPNIKAGDETFIREMRQLGKDRKTPIAMLAGKGVAEGEATPASRINTFLDPTKYQPSVIDDALRQLIDPQEQVVNSLASSHMNKALETARQSGNSFPAGAAPNILRGGTGSEKSNVLDALIRNAVDERNALNTPRGMEPESGQALVRGINQTLDVAQASGRGRQGLGSVADVQKSIANTSPLMTAVRAGAAAPVISQAPNIVQALKYFGDKAGAKALTTADIAALEKIMAYQKPKVLADLIRQGAQTQNSVGGGQ